MRSILVIKMKNPFDVDYYHSEELKEMGFGHVGKNVSIAKNCLIRGLENIFLGDCVRIDGFCTITAPSKQVVIGSYIHIGSHCTLLGGSGIILNDFCGLSHGVMIFTSSEDFSGKSLTNPTIPSHFRKVISGPVVLEKHVIIGAGTIILPKVTMGEGSAVGALSLVRKNLLPWTIYIGNPAKRIATRSQDLLNLEKAFLHETQTPKVASEL
jgi:acetyltransferase-like isoleucine patch superfamily enzyme